MRRKALLSAGEDLPSPVIMKNARKRCQQIKTRTDKDCAYEKTIGRH